MTKPAAPCPVCARPSVFEHRPFCSRGCRDRDLLAWFGEDYRLPVDAGLDSAEGDG